MSSIDPAKPSPTALQKAAYISPWLIIPALYFAQGLPGTMVQQMTGIMLKDLKIENKDLAVFTALIGWPWTLKMFWGALVDRRDTKRSWIVYTQLAITACIAAAALTMQTPGWLTGILISFFVLAFLSATHDIAADGFYLMAVKPENHSYFIGIRSMFFRLSAIFTTSGLVAVAANMQKAGTAPTTSWSYAILAGAAIYGLVMVYDLKMLPRPESDEKHSPIKIGELLSRFVQIVLLLAALILIVRLIYWTLGPVVSPFFGYQFNDMLAKFGTPLFFEKLDPNNPNYGYKSLAMPVQLAISLGTILVGMLAGWNMWTKTGMQEPTKIFFDRPKMFWVLSFILFFRFGEVMIGTMSAPFLQDPAEKGGLGIDLAQVGFINGTVGVIALALGGILGGVVIGKFGIKKALWPMVMALNIPNLFYVYAALTKVNLEFVYGLIAVDQFGYGFGFSAYMVYLLFLCRGRKMETAVYAIATGLMVLGATVARLISGMVFDIVKSNNATNPAVHYSTFFIVVVICSIPGMLTLPFIPMEGEDIKEAPVDID